MVWRGEVWGVAKRGVVGRVVVERGGGVIEWGGEEGKELEGGCRPCFTFEEKT